MAASPLYITIDSTSLLVPSAGVKTYLYYWLLSLLEAAPDHHDRISLYPPVLTARPALHHETSITGPLRTALALRLVHAANLRWSPAIDLLLLGADVFHCSQHAVKLPKRPKVSATVFDMSCWMVPQFHTAANIAATKRYGEKILKSCDGLIAISAHARDSAAAILGIPERRIRVIYPGVAEAFFEATDAQAADVRTRYGLHRAYLLFVGCIEPRKNVAGLIRAYRRLPEALQRDVQLVVAGPFGWASDETRHMLTESGPNVRYLGYVPEPDLPGLSRGALALVYPSYFEGFGLPVAQAMAAGAAVIASDRTCLPEVTGGAALLVDPDSLDQLGDAMERVATCPDLVRDLAVRGQARAAQFHWQASAAQSLDFFHQLAGA